MVTPVDFYIFRTKETSKGAFLLMKERIIERTVNGIKVTSHIPEDVSESFKRNRINQIYDILVAADKRNEESDTDTDKSEPGKSA